MFPVLGGTHIPITPATLTDRDVATLNNNTMKEHSIHNCIHIYTLGLQVGMQHNAARTKCPHCIIPRAEP